MGLPGYDEDVDYIRRVVFQAKNLEEDVFKAVVERIQEIPVEIKHSKRKKKYDICIELTNSAICDAVKTALAPCQLQKPYGILITLFTEYCSHGVSLEPFLCDFYREIGGSMEFIFEVYTPLEELEDDEGEYREK